MDTPDPDQLLMACAAAVMPAGDPLLLAVSGGSDSMALLAAGVRWDRTRLTVAHVHHGLRTSADDDARLVRDVCRRLEVPCEIVDAAPARSPDASSAGWTETAARARRMGALATAAHRRGIPWVAAAHHRGDALETLALHMLRGHRGDRALASIPTVRPLDVRTGLLHPFLDTDRQALGAFREREGLPHREDPTNRDTTIPRNAIRRLLELAAPPLDPDTLDALRQRARRRLEQRLGRVATQLVTAWRPEGNGCVVDREAWSAPAGETAEAWVPEVLRLVGAGLERARVVSPRAGVVGPVMRLVDSGRGTLVVPALPTPLTLRASRAGLHLPAERLSHGDPTARVLDALARTSVYL